VQCGALVEGGAGGGGVVQEAEAHDGLEAVRVGPLRVERDGVVEEPFGLRDGGGRAGVGGLDREEPAEVSRRLDVVGVDLLDRLVQQERPRRIGTEERPRLCEAAVAVLGDPT
jgi:hypothetical protein